MTITKDNVPYRGKPPLQTKYDFGQMSVGDRLVVPITIHENDPWEAKERVSASFRQWRRRTNNGWWRVKVTYDEHNVYVHRLHDEGSEAARAVRLLRADAS